MSKIDYLASYIIAFELFNNINNHTWLANINYIEYLPQWPSVHLSLLMVLSLYSYSLFQTIPSTMVSPPADCASMDKDTSISPYV